MNSSLAQTAPAMTSDAPLINLVSECTTISAPSALGLISSGLKVLSIASGMPLGVSNIGKSRNVGDTQRGIRQALGIDQPGAVGDRGTHRRVIGDIDERCCDTAFQRQEIMQQRVGAAVQRVGRDDVIARIARLKNDGGNRGHTTGAAVCRFGALQRREFLAQHEHGRIEMTPVQIAAFMTFASGPQKDRAWFRAS